MAARGWRYGFAVLGVLAFLTASGAAAPGVWEETAVPVAAGEGARCYLDGTTVKRFTGLSGTTFVDVWVKKRLDAGAAAAGAREVRSRYLFQLTDGRSDQGPLKVELEKQIIDAAGGVVSRKEFTAPGYLTGWSKADTLDEKVLLRLLTLRAFYADSVFDPALARSAPLREAGEGFLGWPWGTRPGAFEDARHVADIGDELAVYHGAMEAGPLLGAARPGGGVWLIFSRRDGLVMARIDVDARQVDAVERHLFKAAGQPLMIDKRVGGGAPGEQQLNWLWHTGRTTEVALMSGLGGATVVVGKRGFSPPEKESAFAARLASIARQAELRRGDGGSAAVWAPADADGFAGVRWGAAPSQTDAALATGGVNLGVATVLFTDAGSRGWGRDVRLIGPGLMVFDGRQGFVGASYRFAPEDYRQVYETLRRTLGRPHTERAETITWLAGANTVYVLDLTEGGRTGVVTVADREFWFSRSVLFEYL